MLEVGLGIDDNNRTVFRYPFDIGDMASVVTPGILHCHEYRTFWIRWGAGKSIEVGQGPVVGQQMITHAQNVTPPFVNAVGLSGGYSRSATWRVQDNAGTCIRNNASHESKRTNCMTTSFIMTIFVNNLFCVRCCRK